MMTLLRFFVRSTAAFMVIVNGGGFTLIFTSIVRGRATITLVGGASALLNALLIGHDDLA